MADRVLLSAGQHNLEACVQLAQEQNLGIEVMAFAYPDVLDGDWKSLLTTYRQVLRRVPGLLTMHGPFMDMSPGSPDRLISLVCLERYQHGIRIAAELGVEVIVFHANYIAAIHTLEYRMAWHNRNVYFWGPLADYAGRFGVTLAVENMWEFDPSIITDVVKEIAHPNLRLCLDVGHAYLFGRDVPFADWLEAVEPLVIHTHINNHDGKSDLHASLADGILDYPTILKQLRALPNPPSLTLEMESVTAMEASLPYFDLRKPGERKRSTREMPTL